ncbi:MAG: hypothetical protein V3T23_13460 [Nitrososphaerales archaeon]
MTTFKWERTGSRWKVFGNKKDPDTGEFPVIWDFTQDEDTNVSKQQAKREMKIFLKSIKKKSKVQPDEQGTEDDN